MIIFSAWNRAACSGRPSKGSKDKAPLYPHYGSGVGKFTRVLVLLRFLWMVSSWPLPYGVGERGAVESSWAPARPDGAPTFSFGEHQNTNNQTSTIGSVPRSWLSAIFLILLDKKSRGWGGIRTHGTFRFSGFQDRRIRPLYHPSRLLRL